MPWYKQQICKNMHKVCRNKLQISNNMHLYAIKYAEICNLNVGISNHMHKIFTLNAKYAWICKKKYANICRNMHNISNRYVKTCVKYAKISNKQVSICKHMQ